MNTRLLRDWRVPAKLLSQIEKSNKPDCSVRNRLLIIENLTDVIDDVSFRKGFSGYLKRLAIQATAKLDKQQDMEQIKNYMSPLIEFSNAINDLDSFNLFLRMQGGPSYIKFLSSPKLIKERTQDQRSTKYLTVSIYFYKRIVLPVLAELSELLQVTIATNPEMSPKYTKFLHSIIDKTESFSRSNFRQLLRLLLHCHGLPAAADTALMLIALLTVMEGLPTLYTARDLVRKEDDEYTFFGMDLIQFKPYSMGKKLFQQSQVKIWRDQMYLAISELTKSVKSIYHNERAAAIVYAGYMDFTWDFIDASLQEGTVPLNEVLGKFKRAADLLGIENWPGSAVDKKASLSRIDKMVNMLISMQ
jgi:hypothetical protein